MAVNRERVEMLVQALESGDYSQARGGLARVRGDGVISYCCLGVACEVAIANGAKVEKRVHLDFVEYDDNKGRLPDSVIDWYGFDSEDPRLKDPNHRTTSAASWNDNRGKTLPEIAALFRHTYLESTEGDE